jgi:hypothetical protein
MKPPIDWLMDGPAFVKYRTLVDLEGESESEKEVKKAYEEMLTDPLVAGLIAETNDWENQYTITRHNDAAHPLHKLVFLADIGIKKDALKPAINSIIAHQSPEGPFQIRIVIPRAFGGDDKPRWDWVATDAPLVLYSLLKLGIKDKSVMKGVEHLKSRIAEPGYPCFASASMGKFRGPGRKDDPCPYANLIILRMMAELPELRNSSEAEKALDMLLGHWQERKNKKYYLFAMGTDFQKLKAPLVWFDILHLLDTLTQYPRARKDSHLNEMFDIVVKKADSEGRFTPESVWTKWKGWEFCQKKEPSRWVTFLAQRIAKRMS